MRRSFLFSTHHRLRTAALIVSIGAAGSLAQASQAKPSGVNPPLAVRATCTAGSPAATVHVQVVNQSGSETALQLGYSPAGAAATQVVSAVTVVAIRPATGADEEFLYVNPKHAALAGRGDPWVVTIAPGATYEMNLPVKDFISRMTYNPLDPAVAGGARLVIDARPVSKPGSRAWVGKVESAIDTCR